MSPRIGVVVEGESDKLILRNIKGLNLGRKDIRIGKGAQKVGSLSKGIKEKS